MKKQIISLTCLILSFTLNLFSQGYNTQTGYIVTTKNDTIYGTFKDRNNLRKGISFRQNGKSDFLTYYPTDLIVFSFANDLTFKACDVPLDSQKTEKIFMQVLVEGYMSLYYAEDEFFMVQKEQAKYLLEKKEDKIKTIEDESGSGARTIAIEDKKYLGIINFLVGDCPKLGKRLYDLKFSTSALSKIVKDYNNCIGPGTASRESVKSKKHTSFLGFKFDYLKNDMENFVSSGLYHNYNFTSKQCLSGGLIINFKIYGKFSFQSEVLLTQRKASIYFKNTIGTPPDFLRWDMVFLEMPQCLYYTFPFKRIQPHLFAGGLFGSKVIDNSDFQTTYSSTTTKMDQLELGYRAGAGLTFNFSGYKKLRVEYYYELTRTNVYHISAGYHQIANNLSASFLFGL